MLVVFVEEEEEEQKEFVDNTEIRRTDQVWGVARRRIAVQPTTDEKEKEKEEEKEGSLSEV